MNSVHIATVHYCVFERMPEMSRIIENPKELILNTAKAILYKDGYSQLSMRNVAKSCGIAAGTIYNYYPTKKDLVIEMMAGYCEEFFHSLDDIKSSKDAFFVKLDKIYNELGAFIKTFREIWLTPDLYDTPDYIEAGLEKENASIEKLIRKIEDIILTEAAAPNGTIRVRLDSYETAEFIVLNFITMVQIPTFKYTVFQKVLKELLSKA